MDTSKLIIAPAGDPDHSAILAIYNHYVERSHVTFDTRPFAIEDRVEWFRQFSLEGPHRLLVARVDDRISGYACSARFRPKPGYRTSVESTLYVDADWTGRGIGSRLYEALFAELEREDVHRAYGGVALPNPASVALHERMGFRHLGTYREVGRKFGRYWDVAWYERPVGSR